MSLEIQQIQMQKIMYAQVSKFIIVSVLFIALLLLLYMIFEIATLKYKSLGDYFFMIIMFLIAVLIGGCICVMLWY